MNARIRIIWILRTRFLTNVLNLILGSSTLPRTTTKATDTDLIRSEKPATTASTTSLYDNVTASTNQGQGQQSNTGNFTSLSTWLTMIYNK